MKVLLAIQLEISSTPQRLEKISIVERSLGQLIIYEFNRTEFDLFVS